MNKLLFNTYFAELLKSRHLTPYQFIKGEMIKADGSLIYRWLSGTQVPPLASSHREQIAQALRLTDEEKKLLRQAQINSLEAKSQQDAVEETDTDAADVMGYFGSGGSQNVPLLPPRNSHTESEKAPRGREAVIEAAINLLRNPPPPMSDEQPPRILLSLQGSDALHLQEQLNAGLYAAMCEGWSVSQCLRLEKNNRQNVELIKVVSNLLGTGRYQPWYFKRSGRLSPSDVLVVPQNGALIFFAANNTDDIDAAILIDDPEQMKILQDHFHQLTGRKEPLMQAYLPHQRPRYWEALEKGELEAGGRLTVRTGLTGLTRPLAWFEEGSSWLEKCRKAGPEVEAWLVGHYQRRIQAFIGYLQAGYVYRDIYKRHGIVRFAQDGKYSKYHPGPKHASLEERREHLQHMIDLLSTYPNYEIALVDEDKEQEIVPIPFWEVTGRRRVLIATECRDVKRKLIKVDLEIKEPTVVDRFVKHFEAIWNHVAASNKDRNQVIAFLQEQIAQVGKATD